eukprot:GILK01010575.1.p1 GENE.GILK01010575.1~~GILK01010575.1.p1  ORF type:complete len:465 (+),score=60.83 GILK01010575.1:32-1396(+)
MASTCRFICRQCRGFGTATALRSLRERGLLKAVTAEDMSEVDNQFKQGVPAVYAGFDPTANSLHVGNLVTIMALAHFQRAGLQAIALVGGATGLVGDPSGRFSERKPLDASTVAANTDGIAAVLRRVLDASRYEPVVPTSHQTLPVEVINNLDWWGTMSAIDFVRTVGSQFRVSSMLHKESVKTRLDSPEGISFTEFSYQIFQAHDFLHLRQHRNCFVQVGGSDQWGNITAGCDLIRKVTGAHAYGVTVPLLTTSSGEKFGKSAGNAIWLDGVRTSAYQLYQFFLNTTDDTVGNLLRFLTFLPVSQIRQIELEHSKDPELRNAQRVLATEVTRIVHGPSAVTRVIRASDVLFGGSMEGLSAQDILEIFNDAPHVSLPADRILGCPVTQLAVDAKTCKSKNEARRLIQQGGISLNGTRIGSIEQLVQPTDIIDNQLLVLRTGKKSFTLIRLQASS